MYRYYSFMRSASRCCMGASEFFWFELAKGRYYEPLTHSLLTPRNLTTGGPTHAHRTPTTHSHSSQTSQLLRHEQAHARTNERTKRNETKRTHARTHARSNERTSERTSERTHHRLTHSFTHDLTHSLTTHAGTHSLADSLANSLANCRTNS